MVIKFTQLRIKIREDHLHFQKNTRLMKTLLLYVTCYTKDYFFHSLYTHTQWGY